MAFQQPQQRPTIPRVITPVVEAQSSRPALPRKQSTQNSQEWILFSPTQHEDRSATSRTPRTATNWSDFESLETRILSVNQDEAGHDHYGADPDDESAELDSLDDGLHAFHQPLSSTYSNQFETSGLTVLPTHDGLGTFPSTSIGLQEQLWQFERHNPRRKITRRRSGGQRRLDAMEELDDQDSDVEDERTARIEKWRLEQSQAVLEEIERETRRRRRRMNRLAAKGDASVNARSTTTDSEPGRVVPLVQSAVAREADSIPHDEQPSESFWKRVTRRVLQDLIGLDEQMLSVIFGEQLLEDASSTPTQSSPLAAAAIVPETSSVLVTSNDTWEIKLLERVARELGLLVHQLAEHDGAFSTYLRTRDVPDYAGIPIRTATRPQVSSKHQRRASLQEKSQISDAHFDPTMRPHSLLLADKENNSLWGIEEEPEQSNNEEAAALRSEQEFWERDVDIKMVFQFLKSRLSSSPTMDDSINPAINPTKSLHTDWSSKSTNTYGTSAEGIRRAQVIRQQHPLVSRAADRASAQSRRRDSILRRHQFQSHVHRRNHSSSCASQSTRRSRCSRSVSSRNYWDIGGSIGSGSGQAMTSALGAWGEV